MHGQRLFVTHASIEYVVCTSELMEVEGVHSVNIQMMLKISNCFGNEILLLTYKVFQMHSQARFVPYLMNSDCLVQVMNPCDAGTWASWDSIELSQVSAVSQQTVHDCC